MTTDEGCDEPNGPPALGAVIEELRTLLRSFGDVMPADMDERFYVHAYNELDLAGRTIIEAFDRERRPTHDQHRK